jgi:hypothetical protein
VKKYLKELRDKAQFLLNEEKNNIVNDKLADELFELGEVEKEKKKTLRINSLSNVDIKMSEPKNKEPEINQDQLLEQLMDESNKSNIY